MRRNTADYSFGFNNVQTSRSPGFMPRASAADLPLRGRQAAIHAVRRTRHVGISTFDPKPETIKLMPLSIVA